MSFIVPQIKTILEAVALIYLKSKQQPQENKLNAFGAHRATKVHLVGVRCTASRE